MSRVRVWYDDACDQIFISGEMHTFAPRSLVCVLNGGGSTILIQMRGSTDAVAGGRFSDFGNHDGLPFETPEDAKAYLDGVFSRGPSVPRVIAEGVAVSDIPAGMPVAVSRFDGSLVPARADTYAQAFVVGIAAEAIEGGFAGTATRDPVTLVDWSPVAGSPSLAVGQPYFLAPEGGLTLSPNDPDMRCTVRVGNAVSRQTFAPVQADPILL